VSTYPLRRVVTVAAAVTGIVAFSAATASAATVELRGGTVSYRAAGGERNDLTVRDDTGPVFHDAGARIRVGAGCRALTGGRVTCGAGLPAGKAATRIDIRLGDRDDRASAEIANANAGEEQIDLYGDAGDDTLHSGSSVGDVHHLFGGAGDDDLSANTNHTGESTFRGGAGDDRMLNGEGGLAWFYGEAGYDVMTEQGGRAVVSDGGAGNDLYVASFTGSPMQFFDGVVPGPGTDTFSVDGGDPISVDLAACGGCVERVIGSSLDDVIRGSSAANVLLGGEGNDIIDPRGGSDRVDAGPGEDRVELRDGTRDTVTCGDDADHVSADARPADAVAADCEVVVRAGA
jgi:Ca2+-binding RTX toxin-like protein